MPTLRPLTAAEVLYMNGSVSSGDTGGDGYKAGYTDVLDWRCRRVVVLDSSPDGSKRASQNCFIFHIFQTQHLVMVLPQCPGGQDTSAGDDHIPARATDSLDLILRYKSA